MNKILKSWPIPVIFSIAIFITIKPVLAQTVVPSTITKVGTQTVDGFTQIYYESGGEHKLLTSGNINSRMPDFDGQYIAYVSDINGAGQVFLYDIGNDTKTQITFIGTNLNPKTDDKGRVIWESWVQPSQGSGEASWQIFFFDGKSIKQLTSGETSINPDISGDYISYARRDISGTWRAVVYSIKDDKSVDVTVGEGARNPQIRNGEIYLAAESLIEEKFPLSVADLFLLNLIPLATTQSAEPASPSVNILNELSATPSAAVEIPLASQSASPAPQSTSSGLLEVQPTPPTSE